jgi:outer membrane protein
MNAFIKNTLLFTFCLISLFSFGQADSSVSLNLKQALDLGLAQRFDIKNQELAIQISESNASIDLRYNAILATNILPPGFIPNTTEYTPVKFGTPYNTLTSITATQNLFNATVAGDKLTNNAQKEYDQISLEKYKADAKSAITQAYYQVLLNKEQIKLTSDNVKTSQTILKQGESEYKNGTLLKTDLSRYQLDVANAQNQLTT